MVKLTEDLILMQSMNASVDMTSSTHAAANESERKQVENEYLLTEKEKETEEEKEKAIIEQYACFRKINCWSSDIDDISILSFMRDLEVVVLSSNSVSDLSPLSKCKKLSQLFLRRNKVARIEELVHLRNLQHLKTMWLMDNPVSELDDYRLKVVKVLPQLHKLDAKVVSEQERKDAENVDLGFDIEEFAAKNCSGSIKLPEDLSSPEIKKFFSEGAAAVNGFADKMAKTSIFQGTQAVRNMGMMKGNSAPQRCNFMDETSENKTVQAIELLLDTLTAADLRVLSESITARLDNL